MAYKQTMAIIGATTAIDHNSDINFLFAKRQVTDDDVPKKLTEERGTVSAWFNDQIAINNN